MEIIFLRPKSTGYNMVVMKDVILVAKQLLPLPLPLLLLLPNLATALLGITGALGKILSVTFRDRDLWLMAQVGNLSTRCILMK